MNLKETYEKEKENKDLLHLLNRGIEDMESGRELPIEEAFQKINDLRKVRKDARA